MLPAWIISRRCPITRDRFRHPEPHIGRVHEAFENLMREYALCLTRRNAIITSNGRCAPAATGAPGEAKRALEISVTRPLSNQRAARPKTGPPELILESRSSKKSHGRYSKRLRNEPPSGPV